MNLARDDWSAVLRLLDEALDLPAPQREGWLAALSPELQRLQPALRQLLDERRAIETGDFLGELPPLPPSLPLDAGFSMGHRIGPFAVLRELGQGGMASVWLAERADGAHAREVALKLPHLGARARVIGERFARERQILSALTHPHIASVLDAGTDGTQPWLAMEYVDGRPITEWATQHRLDVPARLRLFLQVLQAVQHAHAQLVIHRDIKPSNVLVDANGQVKLLDFGVAKLLGDDGATESTELTQLGGRALTPQYASPEQIAGHPLGTASDVYSLGVLLYELLTGQRPYILKRATPAALEEAILAADIGKPSSTATNPKAARAMRGDIDTLVMKALAPQPADRYASAEAFALDIERHLASEPIHARPASLGYRLGKGLLRHRIGVSASAAIALALVIGATLALWQAERARDAAQAARREAARAQNARDFLVNMLRAGDPGAQGGRHPAETTLAEAMRRAETQLAALPPEENDLRRDLLTTLADIHSSIDDTDGTVSLYEQALALSRRVDGVPHAYQAAVLSSLTGALMYGNRYPQAATRNQELGELLGQLRDTSSVVYARHLRFKAALMGTKDTSQMPQARDLLRQATVIFRAAGRSDPGRTGALYLLARANMTLGDVEGALAAASEAVEASQLSDRPQLEHPNALSLRAAMRLRAGHLHDAEGDFRAADAAYGKAFGPRNFLTLQNQGLLGETLHTLGQHEQGMALLQSSLQQLSEVRPNTSTQGYALERLGLAYLREGRLQESIDTLESAIQVWSKLGPDFSRTALVAQAQALQGLGQPAPAESKLARLEALNVKRDGGKPDAATLLQSGLLALSLKQDDAAGQLLNDALKLTDTPTRADRNRRLLALQSMVHLALGQGAMERARSLGIDLAATAAEPALKEDPGAQLIAVRTRGLVACAAPTAGAQGAADLRQADSLARSLWVAGTPELDAVRLELVDCLVRLGGSNDVNGLIATLQRSRLSAHATSFQSRLLASVQAATSGRPTAR